MADTTQGPASASSEQAAASNDAIEKATAAADRKARWSAYMQTVRKRERWMPHGEVMGAVNHILEDLLKREPVPWKVVRENITKLVLGEFDPNIFDRETYDLLDTMIKDVQEYLDKNMSRIGQKDDHMHDVRDFLNIALNEIKDVSGQSVSSKRPRMDEALPEIVSEEYAAEFARKFVMREHPAAKEHVRINYHRSVHSMVNAAVLMSQIAYSAASAADVYVEPAKTAVVNSIKAKLTSYSAQVEAIKFDSPTVARTLNAVNEFQSVHTYTDAQSSAKASQMTQTRTFMRPVVPLQSATQPQPFMRPDAQQQSPMSAVITSPVYGVRPNSATVINGQNHVQPSMRTVTATVQSAQPRRSTNKDTGHLQDMWNNASVGHPSQQAMLAQFVAENRAASGGTIINTPSAPAAQPVAPQEVSERFRAARVSDGPTTRVSNAAPEVPCVVINIDSESEEGAETSADTEVAQQLVQLSEIATSSRSPSI